MLTVDERCNIRGHGHASIYRMVGHCENCGTQDVLVLLTAGHSANSFPLPKCLVCGCHGIRCDRLATPDEIPAS